MVLTFPDPTPPGLKNVAVLKAVLTGEVNSFRGGGRADRGGDGEG